MVHLHIISIVPYKPFDWQFPTVGDKSKRALPTGPSLWMFDQVIRIGRTFYPRFEENEGGPELWGKIKQVVGALHQSSLKLRLASQL